MSQLPVTDARRRLRFSLRTLFALVTVSSVLCGLGWNLRRVNQREQLLEILSERGALLGKAVSKEPAKSVPLLWSILGARPVGVIELPADGFADEELGAIARLFPEANVHLHSRRIDDPNLR